ncbi:MAG: response regulator [candidate division Zixibacteria bacterium]|nr:response regulator [candidate division Zixibacteria bacterium]
MAEKEQVHRLVVVDDEDYICSIVKEALSATEGYQVISFSDPRKATEYLEKNHVDLVLTDLVMGDFSGVEILDQALRCHPDCIVILMTAYPTVNNAISVMRRGAYEYLVKPFKLETLRSAVRRGFEHQALTRENLHLKEQVALYKLSEAMGTTTDLESNLALVAETARSIFGGGAISILVNEIPGRPAVPYLVQGKSPDDETESFLLGDHPLCAAALEKMEACFESREIKGRTKRIRSLAAHPLIAQGRSIGLLNFVAEDPFMQIKLGQLHLLSIIAAKVASAIENNRLYNYLQESYLKAITALANAIEARDGYTRGHTDRVTVLAELIARRLDWDDKRLTELKMGCTLHDIGKIAIPDAILNKPGQLTAEEWRCMETHPQLGVKILEGIDFLTPALPYILYHHEKYDGSGYPHRMAGTDIPIEGRLLMVVDTYDAIVSDRPYRKGVAAERAIEELQRYRGRQFDPLIVDILVAVWNEGKIGNLGIYADASDPASESAPARTSGRTESPPPSR